MVNTNKLETVFNDIFRGETAVTFGGVFTGVSVGETIGVMLDKQLSGMQELGANIGVKLVAIVGTRFLTMGEDTWDGVGLAMSAGLGASALSDVIEYVANEGIGYQALSNMVQGNLQMPQLGGGTSAPPKETKSKMSMRPVQTRTYEDEPLEESSGVL